MGNVTSVAEEIEGSFEEIIQEQIRTRKCIICHEMVDETTLVSCVSIEKSSAEQDIHQICEDCTKQYAKSLMCTGFIPKGGAGLKCCYLKCSNVILLEPLSEILEESVKKRLDARLAAVALRGVENIEYCQFCPYGVTIDRKLYYEMYFHCLNKECGAKFCRVCGGDKTGHLRKSCDEARGGDDKYRELEKEMSSLVIRRCPECSTQFQKESGCNYMNCANCGVTSCYLCRAAPITYAHFRTTDCKLYDDAELKDKNALQERWEEALLDDDLREVAEKFHLEL